MYLGNFYLKFYSDFFYFIKHFSLTFFRYQHFNFQTISECVILKNTEKNLKKYNYVPEGGWFE